MENRPKLQPSFCPSCGHPLDVQQQIFNYKSVQRSFHIFTCWNSDCTTFGRTCSCNDLTDPVVLAKWQAEHCFDVESGRALEVSAFSK